MEKSLARLRFHWRQHSRTLHTKETNMSSSLVLQSIVSQKYGISSVIIGLTSGFLPAIVLTELLSTGKSEVKFSHKDRTDIGLTEREASSALLRLEGLGYISVNEQTCVVHHSAIWADIQRLAGDFETPPTITAQSEPQCDDGDKPIDVVKKWNDVASQCGLPVAREKIPPGREKHIRQRLKSKDWADTWRSALERIPSCPFLIGKGNRSWKADIDWFVRPDSTAKILEGKYDGFAQSSEVESTGGWSIKL